MKTRRCRDCGVEIHGGTSSVCKRCRKARSAAFKADLRIRELTAEWGGRLKPRHKGKR
jgi:hypothetical protein